jgi:heat shock protein HtpX
MYRAREIGRRDLPEVLQVLNTLAHRAGLERVPRLYYVPSTMLNAFAVGGRDDAVIALTDGMLRALTLREIAGVLAHEVSHIRNRDLWLMSIPDLAGRLTRLMSLFGVALVIVGLPLWLDAAGLTGDPEGLASALAKLERYQRSAWEQILFPGYRLPQPSVLRTHPPTEERVARLRSLSGAPSLPPLADRGGARIEAAWPMVHGAPRGRLIGFWY